MNVGSGPRCNFLTGAPKIVCHFAAGLLAVAVACTAFGQAKNSAPRVRRRTAQEVPEINSQIATLDDGSLIKYLDISPKFLDKDGGLSKENMPDYLHLSKKGYEMWAEAIKGQAESMLK